MHNSGHFAMYAKECGHLVSQCRCPGPKARRYTAGLCAACRAKEPRAEIEGSDLKQRDLKSTCDMCGGKGWVGTGWPTPPDCPQCGGTGSMVTSG